MELHKNNGNHGGGVFASGGKAFEKAQLATNRPLCQRKTEGGREKRLANLWSRKKIRKTPHVDRGQTIKWEIPINNERLNVRKTPTKGAAMKPATPKIELPPSIQLRK